MRKSWEDPRSWLPSKSAWARTVIGTPIAVLVTSMLAYPLSRKDLVGRKFWNLLFVFTMYFGGGLVPYYMVLKGHSHAEYLLGFHFSA